MDEKGFDFKKTKQTLRKHGIVVGEAKGPYTPIRTSVIKSDLKNGRIKFDKDGRIYYVDKDGEHQIYMHLEKAYITRYKGKMPKYHLFNCQVIEDFFSTGRGDRYTGSNQEEVSVTDFTTHEKFSGHLEMCGFCRRIMRAKFSDLEEYYSDIESFCKYIRPTVWDGNGRKNVDINSITGYTKDWWKISVVIRDKAGYKCEKCGKDLSQMNLRPFLHVHHRDGNKLDNRRSNLQTLCIECHANVDSTHRNNIDPNQIALFRRYWEEFVRGENKSPYPPETLKDLFAHHTF